MGWIPFVVAMGVFVASHYLPGRTGLRAAAIDRFGRRAYFSVYGLLSVVLLIWVIAAAGRAPYVELWPQLPWLRWLPNLAMPLAAVLVACGTGLRQPFTLGAKRGAEFDPDAPGFAAICRHPLLMALALWAGAHMLANGDLAHVILFGAFLAMPVAFVPVFDARARRELPADRAREFFEVTSLASLAPLADRTWLAANGPALARRTAIGLALWLVALLLHPAVIGVSPLPI